MGAYGIAVAAAFAVALAVLVSVSSTPTAEAATINPARRDSIGDRGAGATRSQIVVADAFARVTITDTADGVGASFVSGGGQSVSCSDNLRRVTRTTLTLAPLPAGRTSVTTVTVALKIDADSGEGHILLERRGYRRD